MATYNQLGARNQHNVDSVAERRRASRDAYAGLTAKQDGLQRSGFRIESNPNFLANLYA